MSEALRTRIRRAARRWQAELTGTQVELLERYLELLARWNGTINLTAVELDGFPESSLDRLLIEPLLAARFFLPALKTWYDLGSGGGSPAIPLKVLRPVIHLSMVESRGRKAAFLRETVRSLELNGADVIEARFQSLGSDRMNSADIITVRAVKWDAVLQATVARLLRPRGRLLVFATRDKSVCCSNFAVLDRCDLPGADNVLEVLVKKP